MVVDSTEELAVSTEDDVVLVRRRAREIALAQGLDPFAAAAVTTATSELARNIWLHAGQGTVAIERVHNDQRTGVRVRFRDVGPGIANLEEALSGGHSTAGSLGLGLYGSRRLVDDFEIDTAPGKGTRVTITKWKRRY